MNEKLNLQDLVDLLSHKVGLPKHEVETFLKELFCFISENLSETEEIKIKDFGAFKLVPAQERGSVDVNTGEKIEIPAQRKVTFLPAAELKDLVNKPFSHFETTLLNDGVSFEDVKMEEISREFDEATVVEKNEEEAKGLSFDAVKKVSVETIPLYKKNSEEETKIGESDAVASASGVRKKRKPVRKKTDLLLPVIGVAVIAAAVLFFFRADPSQSCCKEK